MIGRGEDALTAHLARIARPKPEVLVPIGDDAAAVRLRSGVYVLTTDTLVESVDFLTGEDPHWIGRRAAAANLSDLAAMGATPRGYLLTIAVARRQGLRRAAAIADGVVSKMSANGASLWGGDLSRARETIVSIALIGTVRYPARRSGARPGDAVFVTGLPGLAAEGLRLRRRHPRKTTSLSAAERAYLDPEPRVKFAAALVRRRLPTAMIDVSDGIGRDAARLAAASKVRIDLSGIDVETVRRSGDDFELLFTSAPRSEPAILRLGASTGTRVSRIGSVGRGRGVFCLNGRRRIDVSAWGYDHFEQ